MNIANTYSEDFDVPSVSLSSLAERETHMHAKVT